MSLPDRGHLLTEQCNAHTAHIDRATIEEAFDLINNEDHQVAAAVAAARPSICAAIRLVVAALQQGGRLLYIGAGTSGRLGVLDAAECPPTFMSDPQQVQGIIAGGEAALRRSVEGAEDDAVDAVRAVTMHRISNRDVVMGIAAGGTTTFVHAALAEAKRLQAATIFLACVPHEQAPDAADASIRVLTGPEVITGSTRMKAGTATKMVLNMITTISMIQLGKVFGNLMVDLNREACIKLKDRAVRIISEVTGLSREASAELLREAQDVKTALVMHFHNCRAAEAQVLLQNNAGWLQPIIHEGTL
ncbi:MAG: N-acetylmuramic acid 6-phosphate etherase [Phycisphaerae bacterium]|nr:N-acetylmuramic acid 6-phosphate etherase [Phycisphaerae bacterium]